MKSFELEAYAIAKLLPKKKKKERKRKKRQLDFLHSWLTKLLTQDVTKSLCPDSKSYFLGFPGGLVVKNRPAIQWPGSISESGSSPEKGMATHSSVLTGRISWTEELGGLQIMVVKSWTPLRDELFTFFPKWSTLTITSEFSLHKAKSKWLIVTFSPKEDCD